MIYFFSDREISKENRGCEKPSFCISPHMGMKIQPTKHRFFYLLGHKINFKFYPNDFKFFYIPAFLFHQHCPEHITIHEYAPFSWQVQICYTFFIDTLPKRLPNWLKTSFDMVSILSATSAAKISLSPLFPINITSSPQDTP